jgi:ribonuclease R
MLKLDALNQLKQLKTDIKASRDLHKGVVKGTGQKFGFVSLESGKDAFLPPDEMLRVLPGDRIEVELKKDEKNKSFAKVERLIESGNKIFFGKYVVKGPAHFVEADIAGSARWIFIAPNKRGKTKPGDLLKCKLSQHPFKSGKPQAQILENLGSEKDAGIEWTYSLAKHGIKDSWSDAAALAVESLTEDDIQKALVNREDYSTLPFITIDGEATTDMDDALFIERNDSGWRLCVAIADPEALLHGFPEVEQEALARGSSAYMPGMLVPMLPSKLSSDLSSLVEGKQRLVNVIDVHLNEAGALISSEIKQAFIISRKKLSYQGVTSFLDEQASGDDAASFDDQDVDAQVQLLAELGQLLREWRKQNANVQPSRAEFYIELDGNRQVTGIKPKQSLLAHTLVEECMQVANRCVAAFLKENTEASIYVTHSGVRLDRREAFQSVLSKYVPECEGNDISTLDGFVSAFQSLLSKPENADYLSLLTRQLERTEYSLKPLPHYALGFAEYTTFTSPLRKANDYLLHKQVRELLAGAGATEIQYTTLNKLEAQQGEVRAAAYDLEQWLKCKFIARSEEQYQAEVVRVFTTGFQVRLLENGIEGAVNARDIEGKCSFNQDLMTMTTKQGEFKLGQTVQVKLKDVDWSRKQIQFKLETP